MDYKQNGHIIKMTGGLYTVQLEEALLPDGTPSVRVFNDSDSKEQCTITLPAFATKASMVELDGRHICDLALKDGKVEFTLPAFRIATVRFE